MTAIRPYLLITQYHFQYNISRHWEEFTCKVLTNSSICKGQDALKWKIKDGIWRAIFVDGPDSFSGDTNTPWTLDATYSNSVMGEHIYLTNNHNCLKKISCRGTETITESRNHTKYWEFATRKTHWPYMDPLRRNVTILYLPQFLFEPT